MAGSSKRDYEVRILARFFKDPAVSSDAKILFGVIKSFADGKTGLTFVRPKRLDSILSWGRGRREKAQRELCMKGWLEVGWKRGLGRWARRTFRVCDGKTVARFQRSGRKAHLITYHSQGQVKSSITTSLTDSQIPDQPHFSDVT